jgi:dipeptidyl-peptidase 4
MKNIQLIQTIILLQFILLFAGNNGVAQRRPQNSNPVVILGWVDDSHYLIRNFNSDKNLIIKSVNIKTGISNVVSASESRLELLKGTLPSGVKIEGSDAVSPDSSNVVIVKENDLFYFIKGEKELRRLTNDKSAEANVIYSPGGNKIAYTKNKDIYVFDLIINKEIRLTSDASEKIYNGYSSWVYMEEVFGRQKINPYAAFWWSPDGSMIAYLRTDETDVPVFTLNRLDESDGLHGTLEVVPYPKAGDPNPKVKMGIANVATTKTVWIKTDYTVDQYIAWPFWTPDSKKLAIQILNRDQNNIKLILADPSTGDYIQIYNETSNTWVEFFKDLKVLNNGSGFILGSDKSGWKNLYYYGWNGRLISQLTNFDWRVKKISRVDEDAKVVYFTGTGPESTDNHFFRIGLDGKNLLQITKGPGKHDVSISPKGSYYIDTWNNITTPGSILAYNNKGKIIQEIHKFETQDIDPSKKSKSELVRIKTSDGFFDMPAIITYPLNFDETKKYPVIFRIYGGPTQESVDVNSWQGDDPSWDARNGIITFKIDHRGSVHFGRKGFNYIYRSLGKWEILDYEDAVIWLLKKPYVDGSRMGITGSSYGGYMTCLALTKGADYFTHGFAGSSVTDYRLYDNIYTERYMDTPQDNPKGYKDGSVLAYTKNLKGKLYLTHGDIDDNVHMQNSIWLISKLQDEGKTFQFMMYPDNRHGLNMLKRLHSRNEEYNFWLENFFGK